MSAYLTLAAAKQFAALRNMDVASVEDNQLTSSLLRASELIDDLCAFRGVKSSPSQTRAWPRLDVMDGNGDIITGIPKVIESVCLELALLLAQDEGDAMRAIGLGGGVHTERIGDIHIRYDNQSGTMPPLLRRLWPLLTASQPIEVRRA